MDKTPFPVVVMLSGQGTTLQSLIDQRNGYHIAGVISDQAEAFGLTRAENQDIPSTVIPHTAPSALIEHLQELAPELIVLAGYMRILPSEVVRAFPNQIINVHPALLPKYRGLDTYRRAISAGDKLHGTTVHLVTETLDDGPIIAQAQCTIDADETARSLQEKTQALERQLYPAVVSGLAKKTIRINNRTVFFQDNSLAEQGLTWSNNAFLPPSSP